MCQPCVNIQRNEMEKKFGSHKWVEKHNSAQCEFEFSLFQWAYITFTFVNFFLKQKYFLCMKRCISKNVATFTMYI